MFPGFLPSITAFGRLAGSLEAGWAICEDYPIHTATLCRLMLRIRPFTAIRPQPNMAAQVASVPYDVVNTAEALELARGLPHSFLHVVRSEIDLPSDIDPHDDRVYARARDNL